MSFNLSAGSISGNQVLGFRYIRSGGDNFGAQFAMADSHSGVTLETFNQGMKLEANGSTSYFVVVRNLTPFFDDSFVILGGGLT